MADLNFSKETFDIAPAGRLNLDPLLRGFAWLCLLLTAAICVLPAVVVVLGSFSEGSPLNNFNPSLEPWRRAIASVQTVSSIEYSLLLALRVPVGMAIAFFTAWYLARNDVPGKRAIIYALWLAFFLPILPATLGWVLLLHPNHGLINNFFKEHFGFGLLNIYSLAGITWLHLTLSTVPIMVILIEPAQRLMDISYEEASTMAGAEAMETLRRVTLPLLAPTLLTALIAALIKALETFEVEQLLGVPAGILVYSTRVYNLVGFSPPDEPQAMALSSFFLVILFGLVMMYRIMLERAEMSATLTGKGARLLPRRRTLTSILVSATLFVLLSITIVLPFAMVVLISLSKLFGFYQIPEPWTLAHWSATLTSPRFQSALVQSFLLGLCVAILGVIIYLSLAWFMARNRFRGKAVLSLAMWLPWSIPGILLGMAFLSIFLNVPLLRFLHGTSLALIIVLIVQGLPFATHMFEGSISQISRELEEASLMNGASKLETMLRVTGPLIAPTVASVFVLGFMSAMKDISATVLVASPASQTMPLLMFAFALAGQLEDAAVIGVITVTIAILMAMIVTAVGDQSTVSRQAKQTASSSGMTL